MSHEQLHEALALLENWLGRYGGIEYVPRTWGPSVWMCHSCGAETRATGRGRQAGPPQPFPHTVFCKAEATRALLAQHEPAQEAQQPISQHLPPAVPDADPDRPVRALRVRMLGEETSSDASEKASQRLARAWHAGKLTIEQFQMESAQTLVLIFDREHHMMASLPLPEFLQDPLIHAARQAALAKGEALGLRADTPDEAAFSGVVSLRLTLYEGEPCSVLISSTHQLLPVEKTILDAALAAIPTRLHYDYEEVTGSGGNKRPPTLDQSGAPQGDPPPQHGIAVLKEAGIDSRLLAILQHAIHQRDYDIFYVLNGTSYLTGAWGGICWALGISLTVEQSQLLESWIYALHPKEKPGDDSTSDLLRSLYETAKGWQYSWEFDPLQWDDEEEGEQEP
jgi:hypothetical protein